MNNNINDILKYDKYYNIFCDKYIINDNEKIGLINYILYLKNNNNLDELKNIHQLIQQKSNVLMKTINSELINKHSSLYKDINNYIDFINYLLKHL